MYLQLFFCPSQLFFFVQGPNMDRHQGLGYLRRAALINDSPQGPADCFIGWDPTSKLRFANLFDEAMQRGILFQRPVRTSSLHQISEVPAKAQERVWTVQNSYSMGLRDKQVWDKVWDKLHLSTGKKGKPKETKPRTSSRRPTKDKLKEKEKLKKVQEKAVEKFKRSPQFQKEVHRAAILLHDRWVLKTLDKITTMTMDLYVQALKKDNQKFVQKNLRSTSSQPSISVYQVSETIGLQLGGGVESI